MTPAEVKARILADHVVLRAQLNEAEHLASQILGGKAGINRLRTRSRELCSAVETHMAYEDEHLAPIFRTLDAWGQARADRLRDEHAEQRATLARLVEVEQREATSELARGVQALVKTLLEDMKKEEEDLLKADITRDDILAVDPEPD